MGGPGADRIDGGAGFDMLVYTGAYRNAGVNVNLATGTTSGGHAEGDSIANVERVDGSEHGDTLTGGGSLSGYGGNLLFGWGGDDLLTGGAGDDWLDGGEGDDTLDGGEGDDLLSGGVGEDWLHGGDGDDKLVGHIGDDTLGGGLGDDTLEGGPGADRIDGGAGFDELVYGGSDAGVSVNLSTGTASGGHAEGDTIANAERIIGSAEHADTQSRQHPHYPGELSRWPRDG